MSEPSAIERDRHGRIDAYSPEMSEWLRANRIVPEDVPVHTGLEIDDVAGTITLDQFIRIDGKLQVDPALMDVLTQRVTVKLIEPPSPQLRPVIDAIGFAARRREEIEQARKELLLELGAAGRLHLPCSTMSPEFGIVWLDGGGNAVDRWACYSLDRVRELLAAPPAGAAGRLVETREIWSSPWTAVPEEALQAADEPEGQQQ